MASPGLTTFNAYVDTRGDTAAKKRLLKVKGEELYRAVLVEIPSLLSTEGDVDVVANPSDTKRSDRQVKFNEWYAEIQVAQEGKGEPLHLTIIDQLEGVI